MRLSRSGPNSITADPTRQTAGAGPFDGLSRPFILLEDRLTAGAPARLFRAPVAIVAADDLQAVPQAFEAIEAGLARGLHAAGFMSYELGHAWEPRLAARSPERRAGPLMWFGLFEAPTAFTCGELDEAFGALAPPPPVRDLRPGRDRAEHMRRTQAILDLIGAGDLYQVNLTFPLTFSFDEDPMSLYAGLRVAQPAAYSAVLALDGTTILSVSPELFVEVRDGRARARPMKGTAARGADPASDAAAREGLLADPKQRAENLMIVDLLRNDLSRVARPGGVRTTALFTAETYPALHTLTSTIEAELRPAVPLSELVAALFPCGSVVGAPKIRAAEVIGDLEEAPRGVYTGAIGAIAPSGDLTFNVAIRTAVIDAQGRGTYGVGGGIVADSDPSDEYDEALLKGRALFDLAEDYGLIETFRWSSGQGFVRLPAHLDRLSASADRLGFAFSRPAAAADLADLANAWAEGTTDQRVRLQLSRCGRIELSHQPVATSSAPMTVGVAATVLDAGDPFLRHKTTRRAAYEAAFAQAQALGWDEALLLNREGFVADGSRNSLFFERGGLLVTPAVAHGALPGVLRAALIAEGRAVEGEVRPEDLGPRATWFIGNSLNGLRRGSLPVGQG